MTQLTRSARMAASPRSSPSVLLSTRHPEISFTYNRLTVGSGAKVSATKWIEYYYAGHKILPALPPYTMRLPI
jgi:hypothetical protein